jgi:hypothetical protein
MRFRPLALLLLLTLALGASPAAARPHHAKRLKAFRSCASLVAYARAHVPQLPPQPQPVLGRGEIAPGTQVPASGEAGDSSQTNVQEVGVDEPDMVKTDGETLFVVSGGALHAVDARSATPRLLDTLELDGAFDATILLHKSRAFLLGSGPQGARITEVDVRDPSHLAVVRTQDLEGYIVDARQTGRSARIVVTSVPDGVYGPPAVRATTAGWVPGSSFHSWRSGRRSTGKAVRCRAIARPAVFSGAGVLTVLTVDLAKGLPAIDADAVFTSADTVYASTSALYVATQRWESTASTALHRFDISDPDRTRYTGSGSVPGTLLNQFALSEDKGVLRAATTEGSGADAESRVTTLEPRAGALVRRGHVGGLGKGERIYAVRFIGDAGYVVTYRQVDPLFTLDLADPDHPRVVGELKIPGYSAYLHPVGPDLLLGVGQQIGDEGGLQGLQLSLFDVADPAHPTRLRQFKLNEHWSQSAVEWDHHAFLWWPATQLAVLPIDSDSFTGAAGFRVDRADGITELGRISHAGGASWTPSIERAVVVGRRLLTVSALGVKASGLDSFAGAGWAAFPEPPPNQPIPVDAPVAMSWTGVR